MENSTEFENTSGHGKDSVVPEEIRGWNWGAFFLNWLWGIGNSTYIALLMFVPLVNFVMPFVLGAKGNEWAWRNRTWRDIEQFRETQRKWGWAGLVLVVLVIPACVALPMSFMKKSEVYKQSFSMIQQSAEVEELLGAPLESGWLVMGNISTSGPTGQAALQYSVQGPLAEGNAYVYAKKNMGQWELLQLAVEVPSSNTRLTLVAPE